MAKDKTAKDFDDIAKAIKEGTMSTKEASKAFSELNKELEDVSSATISLANNEARLNEMFGDSLAAVEASREVLRQFKEVMGDAYENTDKLTEAQIKQIESTYGSVEAMKAAAKAAQEKVDELEKLGPAYEKALKKSKPYFEDVATKMGLMSKSGNKLVKGIAELGQLAGEEGGLKGLATGFTEAFNPLNAGISILSKVVEQTIALAFGVDKAGAAFAKATGFGREFDGIIADTSDSMRQLGVLPEDVSNSLISLRTGLSQFNTLGASTQQNLTNIVTGLEKLGVSTEDSVKTIATLNKAFGTTEDRAAEITRELALTGKAIGMTTSQITKEFNSALGTLAVYGERSVKIFSNIAAMAQAAQVEVGDLMGIANKFDTFSDSALTAAKMNAILGTSFSGVNMMLMDHDERIEQVIKGLNSTGQSFKDLDKFTQQAVATQLGIKDMAQANKILGMSLGSYKRMRAEQEATAKTNEAMEKRMKEALNVAQEFKLIFAEFAINIKPAIPMFKDIIRAVSDFILKLKDMNSGTIVAIGIGLSFIGFLKNMVGMSISLRVAGKVASKTMDLLGTSAAGAITKLSTAGAAGSAGIGALGVSLGTVTLAVMGFGLAIALVVASFALLAKVILDGLTGLAGMGVAMGDIAVASLGMGASLLLVALGITAVALAVASMANPFSATGAAVLIGVVVAIAAAAAGIGYLFDKLANSSKVVADMAVALKEVAGLTGNIDQVFSSLDSGFDKLKGKLNDNNGIKVQAALENIALISTGKSASAMTGDSVGAAVGSTLSKFVDTVAGYFDGDSGGNEMKATITLDRQSTIDLLTNGVGKAHIKTGK